MKARLQALEISKQPTRVSRRTNWEPLWRDRLCVFVGFQTNDVIDEVLRDQFLIRCRSK